MTPGTTTLGRVPRTERLPPSLPAAAPHVLRLVHRPGPRPQPSIGCSAPSSSSPPSPRGGTQQQLHVTRAAGRGEEEGNGREDPRGLSDRLPPPAWPLPAPPPLGGASGRWRDWDARGERLQWSKRRAGVTAKAKARVEGQGLSLDRAPQTQAPVGANQVTARRTGRGLRPCFSPGPARVAYTQGRPSQS